MSHHPYPYTPLPTHWNFPFMTQYTEAYPGASKFPGSHNPVPEIEELVNEGRWTHDNRGLRIVGTDQYTLYESGPRRMGQPQIELLDARSMRNEQLRREEAERRRYEEEMRARQQEEEMWARQQDAIRRDDEERRAVRFAPTRRVRPLDFETGMTGQDWEEEAGDNEGRSREYRRRNREEARRRRREGSFRVVEQPGYRGPLW